MATQYRRAYALDQLLEQVNLAYPGRDKESDGWIGDAAHASRSSDHNPWVKDGKMGIVTAIDIDEDLALNLHTLANMIDAICASKEERVKYIIYEGRITVQGSRLQAWKKYTGVNAHKHHAHISVFPEKRLYDSRAPWVINGSLIVAKPDPISVVKMYTVQKGDSLWGIARKYKTDVPTLKRLNKLTTDIILVNDQLQVTDR